VLLRHKRPIDVAHERMPNPESPSDPVAKVWPAALLRHFTSRFELVGLAGIRHVRRILTDATYREEIAEHNFHAVANDFSFTRIEPQITGNSAANRKTRLTLARHTVCEIYCS